MKIVPAATPDPMNNAMTGPAASRAMTAPGASRVIFVKTGLAAMPAMIAPAVMPAMTGPAAMRRKARQPRANGPGAKTRPLSGCASLTAISSGS